MRWKGHILLLLATVLGALLLAPAGLAIDSTPTELAFVRAVGQAPAMIAEWLHSPEHRANLLRPGFTRIGIGIARGRFLGNKGAVVITADFASA